MREGRNACLCLRSSARERETETETEAQTETETKIPRRPTMMTKEDACSYLRVRINDDHVQLYPGGLPSRHTKGQGNPEWRSSTGNNILIY